ncbi:MAG: hypothetical protein NTV49_05460 [Kiritimatiellaeota bacterium]|nr:hypothetical protein [Kiritimatiellota bacterium]
MRTQRVLAALFIVAAVYEGLLGVAFLFGSGALFQWFGVTPPNHPGYVQFPAALLIVFAVMFMAIARNPARNRNLIPYGILLKASYCGVVSFHWFIAGLPGLWKPFCIFDLVFLIAFAWAWTALRKEKAP